MNKKLILDISQKKKKKKVFAPPYKWHCKIPLANKTSTCVCAVVVLLWSALSLVRGGDIRCYVQCNSTMIKVYGCRPVRSRSQEHGVTDPPLSVKTNSAFIIWNVLRLLMRLTSSTQNMLQATHLGWKHHETCQYENLIIEAFITTVSAGFITNIFGQNHVIKDEVLFKSILSD